MAIDLELVERIYEAAALPALWPGVLQTIADRVGAAGGVFFTNSRSGLSLVSAPKILWFVEAYIAQGWAVEQARGAPLIDEMRPGFHTDADFRSAEERAALPVYRDFLIPNGIDAGAATVFQGADDDAIVLSIEQFGSHDAAAAAIPFLNGLRPHLGRALSLSSRLGEAEAASTVAALQLAGVPAAVVSGDGRLRAVNDRFTQRMGDRMMESRLGLRFADRSLQMRFVEVLAARKLGLGGRSIAVAATDDQRACAIHLLPLRRGARDVFGWDGVLMLLAEAANASVPHADLLRLLFDLTPTEARLTRHLLEGRTPAEAAKLMRITEATARVHLRRIFAKTGVRRQAELLRLLLGLGGPG